MALVLRRHRIGIMVVLIVCLVRDTIRVSLFCGLRFSACRRCIGDRFIFFGGRSANRHGNSQRSCRWDIARKQNGLERLNEFKERTPSKGMDSPVRNGTDTTHGSVGERNRNLRKESRDVVDAYARLLGCYRVGRNNPQLEPNLELWPGALASTDRGT